MSNTNGITIHDTGRLKRLLQELDDPLGQKPCLWFFVGRRAKDDALKELFPWNNIKRCHQSGVATLRIETSRMHTKHPILFADSDPFTNSLLESDQSLTCHETSSYPLG